MKYKSENKTFNFVDSLVNPKHPKNIMKRKCNICGKIFKNKQELIEHLVEEYEDSELKCDAARIQLEELGIKNPYDVIV